MGSLRVEVDARSPLRCPYCHDDVSGEEWSACATCLARHHDECWATHEGCGTCGRDKVLRPEHAAPRKSRPSRVLLGLALFAILVACAELVRAYRLEDETRTLSTRLRSQEERARERAYQAYERTTKLEEEKRLLDAKNEDLDEKKRKLEREKCDLEAKLADYEHIAQARAAATGRALVVAPYSVWFWSDELSSWGKPTTLPSLHVDARETSLAMPRAELRATTYVDVLKDGTFEIVVRSDGAFRVRIDDKLVCELEHVQGDEGRAAARIELARGRHTVEVWREGGQPVKLQVDLWRAPY